MSDLRRLAIAGCLVAVACGPAPRTAEPTPSRRVLLEHEIRGAQVATAYQIVARLRPEWLRRRGRASVRDPTAGAVVVYLDGMRQGGVRALDAIVAETVREMEYLSGQEATTRFGTGHGGGVILVRLR
ncbi:MAG: hypothetical protein E6J91_48220 [Deltaproteobacteria bacterium]|nr:MAG: hypothetical protein E6J91_48220 [Deltaproteobacteria bacterium]HXG98319.1 hypothetical protein [Gemmatimonadales bacterium]